MKIFVIIMAVCITSCYSQAATKEQQAMLIQYKDACIDEIGVDRNIIDEIFKGALQFVRSEKTDCFAACLLRKLKFQRPDGTIDDETIIKAAINPTNINAAITVINKCKDLGGKDNCEIAGKALACFIKNKTYRVFA